MSQTFKLYRLQQIDSQLDRIRARVRQIEAALNEDQAIKEAQKILNQATQLLEAQHKSLRYAEEKKQTASTR